MTTKQIAIATLLLLPSLAQAACRFYWIDHDFNTFTPAIRQEVCDNTYDPPSIDTPSIPPVQRPQIEPVAPPVFPPFGTTECRTVSVYNEDARQWETVRVCE